MGWPAEGDDLLPGEDGRFNIARALVGIEITGGERARVLDLLKAWLFVELGAASREEAVTLGHRVLERAKHTKALATKAHFQPGAVLEGARGRPRGHGVRRWLSR